MYISISFSCQDLDLRLGAKTRNNDADMSYRRRISLFLLFYQTTHWHYLFKDSSFYFLCFKYSRTASPLILFYIGTAISSHYVVFIAPLSVCLFASIIECVYCKAKVNSGMLYLVHYGHIRRGRKAAAIICIQLWQDKTCLLCVFAMSTKRAKMQLQFLKKMAYSHDIP